MTLEITETAAIQNIDETAGFVTRAKDLGCRIAIDDFGAGYTSFRNLRRLGVDMIKIDGAFVQNLPRSEDDRVFVRTLIDLGRSLGLTTVAEWVQDEEGAAVLRNGAATILQGALIGRASLERPWVRTPTPDAISAADAYLSPVAQLLDLLAHVVELALELVEIGRRSTPPASRPRRRACRVLLAPRERREHRERLLEHVHVAADLVLDQRAERRRAEGLRESAGGTSPARA